MSSKNIIVSVLILFLSWLTVGECSLSRSAELRSIWAREYNDTIGGRCTKRITSESGATTVIDVCCKGYEPYEYDPKKCIPACRNGCDNGFCVAPNVCNCFDDHVRSHDDRCVPTCPISCLNGVCNADGTCICNPRHILDPSRKYCLPICHGSCGLNRYCSAPGQCSCIRGFKENSETGECEPICPMNCLNGRCISPGICACKSGYQLKDDICQSNCTSCVNGKCVAPDFCSCDPGYTYDLKKKMCIPVCTHCANGQCTAPGVCQCNEGYEQVNGVCVPQCEGGCKNGYCVEPDKCNCQDGYARNIFGQCKRLRCTIAEGSKTVCSIKHIGS